jgi:hypothetical protein
MSAWRRRAIEAFPELRKALNDGDEVPGICALWPKLRPIVEAAHQERDDDFLRRAYAFAEWCRVQRDKDMWNSVGVSFYEHAFDVPKLRPLVAPWLSAGAIRDNWPAWESRLTPEEMREIGALLGERAPRS